MTHPLGPESRLVLIDGSGYIFRAYHALPPLTRASDGAPVGAVSGFCNMLFKLIADQKAGLAPTHLAVIFDKSEDSFRKALYPAYKAQRPPPPEDLVPQFAMIREATRAFGLPCIELGGYEADDLIATYAHEAEARGAEVTIISSDKDLMQLVTDRVQLYDPMKDRPIGRAEVIEKFGVPPEKVIDVQALMGDSVDNVPGVAGIGGKSAPFLISKLGSLDFILSGNATVVAESMLSAIKADMESIAGRPVQFNNKNDVADVLVNKFGISCKTSGNKKGGYEISTEDIEILSSEGNHFAKIILDARGLSRAINSDIAKVMSDAEAARISRALVTLARDAPLPEPLEALAVREPDPATLLAFLEAMEFKTITRRVRDSLAREGHVADAAPTGPIAATTAEAAADVRHDAYETVRDLETLARWIARARAAGVVAVDTETDALGATSAGLVGVSLALGPNDACYIPLAHREKGASDLFGGGGLLPGQAPLQDAVDLLKPLLEDETVLKVGQNIKYDLAVLARYGVTVAPYDDTMLISYALATGQRGHGMDELSERLLGHRPIAFKEVCGSGKAQISFAEVPLDVATRYAAEDADITLRLWALLKPRLAREGLLTVYETLERPMPAVLSAMELAGVKVDRATLSRLSGDFAQRMAALEAEAHQIAGRSFNLGSPKQLGEILFDAMALPGGRKTQTGAWSTDADVLEDLAAQGHALPRVLLDWRTLSKLKGTYTDALPQAIDPHTGRVHSSFALAATTTGRLSSSDPNLQNIPIRTDEGRRIREAFVAEPGNLLISADYSQIELRLLAHVADMPVLKQAFRDGIDIHAMTASEVFGVPVEGMDPMVRRRAKAINFGIVYGISAFGLANQLSIPQGEAADYIKRYFERFPGIRAYMDAMKAQAREKGYVETVFGRRCWIAGIAAKSQAERAFAERQAINAPLQGAAADVIRRAMARLPSALARAGLQTRMLLQVHDELVFEGPAGEAEAACALIRTVMEGAALPAAALSVPLVVEAKAAPTWALAH